ncbi:MAG: hypothetical protein CM15mV88_370 [Caudoviricetes sp.]|nr:MAG: hypothetical protein CM15mV88_370 [Caudoviricetes sp.]
MAVLYRPVLDTYNDKYNIEEYKADGSEHFKDLPMDIVFGSMLFLSFRNRLVESYDILFGEQQGDTTTANAQFGLKWGWYQSIFALSQGDITRFENITKLGMHESLMMLTFMKEKNELEARQLKRKYK